MNLLELLRNEKVVKSLEKINTQLQDLIESNTDDIGIRWKILLIIETLLTRVGAENKHIGEYFSRYSLIQNEIDDVIERIKKLKVQISDSEFEIDDLNEKIKAGGYSVDKTSFEGKVFEILKRELIDNKKLNYKYGRE
jgi:predicted  nucleic acid-binding Zn-ribbon protein